MFYGWHECINIKMKSQILEIINSKPKHFSKIIKNNESLLQWVNNNTQINTENFPEKVYSALYSAESVCPKGNPRKFKSIFAGYGYCNTVSKCECAKQQVAEKISKTKQAFSAEKKQRINQKRETTSLKKYGVSNNGQTETAKQNHKKFYQNPEYIESATSKGRLTKLEKYGNPNYNNPEKIKQTWRKRFNADYWEDRFPEKGINELRSKDILTELFKNYTIEGISKKLSVHTQTVYKYLNMHDIRTPYKSSEEAEVVNFLREEGVTNIIENSRKILKSGKELDIYLPDYSLAIEYNGVYWHHDGIDHITRSYHKNKFDECASNGIQLLTIFSTQWKSKQEIVKNILRNHLGIHTHSIFARKCEIVDVTSAQSRKFLDQYHVQGYTTSSIRYGLKYNSELVALMTFSKSRTGMGVKEDAHELVRFASSTRVVGGASKLLNHFLKQNNVKKLISYSDNEWSDGNLYKVLGFGLENDIPPSYWYLKPHTERLYHRYNFAKHKLVERGFDSSKTETQITREMGLLKIWDCGKKRWVYNKT